MIVIYVLLGMIAQAVVCGGIMIGIIEHHLGEVPWWVPAWHYLRSEIADFRGLTSGSRQSAIRDPQSEMAVCRDLEGSLPDP